MNVLTIDIGDNVSDPINADPAASLGIGGTATPCPGLSGPDQNLRSNLCYNNGY